MNNLKRSTFPFLLSVLVFFCPSAEAQTVPQFLSVSDMHFNPYFDSSLLGQLVKSDESKWQAIFESSSIKTPNSYGSDANYPLFRSVLEQMQKQRLSPNFIVISGDFLCHSFQSQFQKWGSAYFPDSLQSFTAKTIRFVASQINAYFPKTIVLPVLGNNDSYCGDYGIQPGDPFLAMFARAFVPLQRNGSALEDSAFVKQFSVAGYYQYKFPWFDGRMIMMNSVLFSGCYYEKCGGQSPITCAPPAGDPGSDELAWISDALRTAATKGEKVWMAGHVPPGIDVFSSLYDTIPCGDNIVPQWKEDYLLPFRDTVIRYASTIRASLAGHTHMDDFRVIYDDNKKPVSFVHITPAASPRFGNNPGFQLITYSPSSMELLNSETFYLNVQDQSKGWQPEYGFQKKYGVYAINAVTLDQVREKIWTNKAILANYMNFFPVLNPSVAQQNLKVWPWYWCGTGAITIAQYKNCQCAGSKR